MSICPGNAAELVGACIGCVAVALNWNRDDIRAFSRIVSSTGIASVAGANPALALVTIVALAKAFTDARREGDYTEFVEGLAKGGVGTGAVLATASAVGGPVFVPVLAKMCAGVLANKAMNRVDARPVSDYMVRSISGLLGRARGGARDLQTNEGEAGTAS